MLGLFRRCLHRTVEHTSVRVRSVQTRSAAGRAGSGARGPDHRHLVNCSFPADGPFPLCLVYFMALFLLK